MGLISRVSSRTYRLTTMNKPPKVTSTTRNDEFVYFSILLASFLFGFYLTSKFVQPGKGRKILSTIFGTFLVVAAAEMQFFHSLVLFILTVALLKMFKNSKLIIFITIMSYLLFFRKCNDWFPGYFNKPSPFGNVTVLMTVLRLISYSFDHQNDKFTSIWDFYSYNYCYIGLFSGPFYHKKVYDNFINGQNLDKISVKTHLWNTFKPLPIVLVLYLSIQSYRP